MSSRSYVASRMANVEIVKGPVLVNISTLIVFVRVTELVMLVVPLIEAVGNTVAPWTGAMT